MTLGKIYKCIRDYELMILRENDRGEKEIVEELLDELEELLDAFRYGVVLFFENEIEKCYEKEDQIKLYKKFFKAFSSSGYHNIFMTACDLLDVFGNERKLLDFEVSKFETFQDLFYVDKPRVIKDNNSNNNILR